MKAPKREIEIQLLAPKPEALGDLPRVLRKACRRVTEEGVSQIRDVYLDTQDLRLLRAGLACRVRSSRSGLELGLKTLRPVRRGLASRAELTERVSPGKALSPDSLPDGDVASVLRPLLGKTKLRELFHVRQSRRGYMVMLPSRLRALVSADRVEIVAGDERASVTMLEIELLEGRPKVLRALGEKIRKRLGLTESRESKFERGLRLAGVGLPVPPDAGDVRLEAADRLGDVAARIVAHHFSVLLWNEAGVKVGLDPAYLHDMRVAARRIREAFSLFRDAWVPERTRVLRSDLERLSAALGRVRDIDVHLRILDEDVCAGPALAPGVEAVRLTLQAQREHARKAMLRVLRAGRYQSLVRRIDGFLEGVAERRFRRPMAQRPVVSHGFALVERRLRKVLKAGRAIGARAADNDLHRLRIRCKRLRYACEFLAGLYGGPARKMARRVTVLQDILGDHHDTVVAMAKLELIGETLGAQPGERHVSRAIERMLACHARRTAETRRAFSKAWKEFDRPKVRKPLCTRMQALANSGGTDAAG